MVDNPLKPFLRKASREAVEDDVRKLRTHLSLRRWIGQGNIYAKNYRVEAYKDILTRQSSLKKKQLRDYVAASIFNHCGDGWSLLGRALSLSIKGDGNSSVHLAYYAELRAAMSLLASEGIGVFNSRHVIISDNAVELTPDLRGPNRRLGRTHKFVWMALEHWSNRKPSAERLANIISPGSIKLTDWFSTFGISANLHPVGSSWLKSWGVDIKQFGDDQVLRNHSSYRPSRIVPRIVTSAADSLSFISELWRMCEPNPSSRFDEIDRYLLRTSIAQVYLSIYGKDPRSATHTKHYREWVNKRISKFSFSAGVEKEWVAFLTWEIHPQESRIIEEAGKITSIDDPNHHLQVLARAILLLRISTGMSGYLLQRAGFTKTDLEFWWMPYATDHGLIESSSSITDFLDLWSEIDIALNDIETWSSSHTPPYSYNRLMSDISPAIFRLSECERISLWGLGI